MGNVFKISISKLKIKTIIGVLEIERYKEQTITIDIDLLYKKQAEIIDYSLIREMLIDTFKKNKFHYLEDAIECIASAINMSFRNIIEVSITINKPDIFDDCVVSVNKKISLGQ